MSQAKEAKFQFVDFLVIRSLIQQDELQPDDLEIDFAPKGKLDFEKGEFYLFLDVKISDKKTDLLIEINSIAKFNFNDFERDRLSPFLYHNAPAILFPYIRAHISTLTSISGIRSIIIPTMNLQSLKSELEDNIEEI